jgi:hypothetical protein
MKLVLGIKNGRSTRWLAGLVAIGAGAILTSACTASSAQDASTSTDPAGGVALHPASGSVNSTPTWSTSTACPAGYQGSAVFRAVRPDGTTYSISGATDTVTTPFHGTLLGNVAEIASLLNSVPNGTKQKYVVVCFSGPSLTGKEHQEMSMFVTYSHETYKSTYKS